MKHVVIAGGGYAGLAAARTLAGRPELVEVTLVDRLVDHQLLTRLPEVFAGTVAADQAVLRFDRVLPITVRTVQAEITGLDPKTRSVSTTLGTITGDILVLTTGSTAGYHEVPGAAEYGRSVRSIDDALHLRFAVLDQQVSGNQVRVVVVGAGYTGTEMAGECASWPGGPDVTLVAADPRLLPQGNERVAELAERILAGKHVKFMLGMATKEVDSAGVSLADGTQLPADIVIWAAPAVAPPLTPQLYADYSPPGRLVTDPFLHVPRWKGVFAAGDVALIPNPQDEGWLPSSAQIAVQAGRYLAKGILAEIEERSFRVFRPTVLGEALSLGGHDGVAEVLGAIVTGRRALSVKQAALIRYIWEIGGARLVRGTLRDGSVRGSNAC